MPQGDKIKFISCILHNAGQWGKFLSLSSPVTFNVFVFLKATFRCLTLVLFHMGDTDLLFQSKTFHHALVSWLGSFWKPKFILTKSELPLFLPIGYSWDAKREHINTCARTHRRSGILTLDVLAVLTYKRDISDNESAMDGWVCMCVGDHNKFRNTE